MKQISGKIIIMSSEFVDRLITKVGLEVAKNCVLSVEYDITMPKWRKHGWYGWLTDINDYNVCTTSIDLPMIELSKEEVDSFCYCTKEIFNNRIKENV